MTFIKWYHILDYLAMLNLVRAYTRLYSKGFLETLWWTNNLATMYLLRTDTKCYYFGGFITFWVWAIVIVTGRGTYRYGYGSRFTYPWAFKQAQECPRWTKNEGATLKTLNFTVFNVSPPILVHLGCFWTCFDRKTRGYTGKGLRGYGYGWGPRYPGVTRDNH